MPLESDWTDEAEEDAKLRRRMLRAAEPALEFVSAEEAAKWDKADAPYFLSAKAGEDGAVYKLGVFLSEASIRLKERDGYDRFARLPDALPELSK